MVGYLVNMISAPMIVRNEEQVLARCLDSIAGVDEIVILDTGSTDSTGDVARKYTSKYYAGEYKWDDNFAEARNRAVEKCTGDWIFIIDADEVLEEGGIKKIRRLIEGAGSEVEVVDFKIVHADGGEYNYFPRLYRRKPDIYWLAPVHSYLSKTGNMKADITITHIHPATRKRMPDRALKSLQKEIKRNPQAIRELFYLAREYVYRRDWIPALYWYSLYLKRARWGPEIAEAYLQMAKCYWWLHRGEEARKTCIQAILVNADFKEALQFMAEISGPINNERWGIFAETAKNRNVLFVRTNVEKPPEFYDGIYSRSADVSRYEGIYRKAAEWCQGLQVLDIGCGTAELGKYIQNYRGFDFSQKAISIGNHKNVWVGTAYDSKNYDGSYDAFVAIEVLEHLNEEAVTKNIPRGKLFVFSVPSWLEDGHLRRYNENTIRDHFKNQLSIEEVIRFNWAGKWTASAHPTDNYIILVKSRRI